VRYNHVGIPTAGSFDGEIPLPHLKMTVSDHLNNPFGIQWQRYWDDAPYPDLVKTVPHVAFEVDDLAAALEGQQVIIEPNSPSRGVLVAFIEVGGAPVELMQIDHQARPDLLRPRLVRQGPSAARGRGRGGAGAPDRRNVMKPRIDGVRTLWNPGFMALGAGAWTGAAGQRGTL